MSRYSGTRNAHTRFDDLDHLLRERFNTRASKWMLPEEVCRRFRVHCLKHDLEVLMLAAPDQIRQRLRTDDSLKDAWRQPVEDQNDHRPPKRVVEDLFRKYRKKRGYVDTVDAPWILGRASLAAVEKACPERFGPFLSDLRQAISGS